MPAATKKESTTLIDDNGTHSDPETVSECFNRFFSTIGSKLASVFANQPLPQDNPYPEPSEMFSFQNIHVEYIQHQLSLLDTKNATGLDFIHARLLKDAAPAVAGPLTTIMNSSLSSGQLPAVWKSARVTAIYKEGTSTDPSNYRPISVLSICMKVFERAVHDQLSTYLTRLGYLCTQQSGFRKGHSTMTALVDVTDYVLSNMNEGCLTGVVYLDLRKAFDTVDPEVLIHKLSWFGIKKQELLWFQNYLLNRKQQVANGGNTSKPMEISHGVPQGSILGPLLFIMFVNDLPKSIRKCKIALYADDTVLMCPGKTATEVQEILQDDLNRAQKWLKDNRLHLNTKKTKWSLLGTPQKLARSSNIQIYIEDEPLEHVDTYKYLGFWIDQHLKWNEHIDQMCKKISKRLGLFRRIRHCLPAGSAKMLYNALVLPLFDYGNVIYNNSSAHLIKKLQTLQNRGARIILQCPFRTHSKDMLKDLHWLSVKERAEFHDMCLVYKCLHGLTPNYLSHKFHEIDHVHNTRSITNNNLSLVKPHIHQMKRTFQYRGAYSWNQLDTNIRNCSTLTGFRTAYLKKYFN